jgi:hypothetical protein
MPKKPPDPLITLEVVVDTSAEARDAYREAIKIIVRRIREKRERSLTAQRVA